jgi:hypothetical protein
MLLTLGNVTGLAFSSITANGLAMQWSPVAGATGYQILRSTDGTNYSNLATVTATSYSDSSLTPQTPYYYGVLGVSATDQSASPATAFTSTSAAAGLPSPWTGQDIGAVGGKGSSGSSSGTFTEVGSGGGITGTADAFRFTSQPMTGNGTIVARVVGETNVSAWASAGVMIRNDLTPGSVEVMMGLTPNHGAAFLSRTGAGGYTGEADDASVSTPSWVKLVRSGTGSTITGYTSADGINWVLEGSVTVSLGSTVQVGLAFSAGNNSQMASATMDNVSITLAPPTVTSFTATRVSSTQVKLAWSAPSSTVTGYNIFRSTSPGQESSVPVNSTPVTGTSFIDTTVDLSAPGSGYYYQIVAVNKNAFSPSSKEVSALTALSEAEAGTWTALTNSAPAGIGRLMLLSDGTVMAQGANVSNAWYKLTPSSTGSYLAGTWSPLASMIDSRLYYASDVLPSGKVFVAGGEYGTGGAKGEIYDPVANTWTALPAQNLGSFYDSGSETLPDGRVLITPVNPSVYGGTVVYDPAANTWSQGPTLVRGANADEQSFVKLPDGSILSVDGAATSERFIPSLNQWVDDAAVPVNLFNGGEIGAALLLPSGNAFFIGGSGSTAIYTPSGTQAPGAWVQGPTLPWGLGAFDAPAAMMPDGKILLAVGPVNYGTPTTMVVYDPVTNAFASLSSTPSYPGAPYTETMLVLPDGGVLVAAGSSKLYEFKPTGAPSTAWQPTITGVSLSADGGSFLLTGTQLNGMSEGAAYGDDAQMASNYPIVRLVNPSTGAVYYARTSNWSSTGVQTGGATETVAFTLPRGIPAGTYNVYAVANGIASAAASITVTAPAIVTPAAASSSSVTGTTTDLSVLGSAASGESTLTYTWAVTALPTGATAPTFSSNASNAAKSTTVTFNKAGYYTFKVTITNPLGLSTSSSVSVTVRQTLTGISISPGTASVAAGATQQLKATALDQFGIAMATQPTFTWSVLSGGGKVSSLGVYTAPASTGSAVVAASAGGLVGSAAVTITPPPPPAAPSSLTASTLSSSQIKLSWKDNSSNESGFTIETSLDGVSWVQIGSVGAGVTSYTATGLSAGTKYYFRVRSYNAGGTSSSTSTAYATTSA